VTAFHNKLKLSMYEEEGIKLFRGNKGAAKERKMK